MPQPVCSECGAADELRPYGQDGKLICLDCAKKPQNLARARAAIRARLEACLRGAVIVVIAEDAGTIPREDLCPMAKP